MTYVFIYLKGIFSWKNYIEKVHWNRITSKKRRKNKLTSLFLKKSKKDIKITISFRFLKIHQKSLLIQHRYFAIKIVSKVSEEYISDKNRTHTHTPTNTHTHTHTHTHKNQPVTKQSDGYKIKINLKLCKQ